MVDGGLCRCMAKRQEQRPGDGPQAPFADAFERNGPVVQLYAVLLPSAQKFCSLA